MVYNGYYLFSLQWYEENVESNQIYIIFQALNREPSESYEQVFHGIWTVF